MSNSYLTTNGDVNDAYLEQAGSDNAMTAEEFAEWHYTNYGQKEGRSGWDGGGGDSGGDGGGILSQAGGSDSISLDSGSQGEDAPPEDYRTGITTDLTRLESGKPEDLNAYLATTKYTPQQLAEVSGYNEDDIIKAIANAKTTYTPTQVPGLEAGAAGAQTPANVDNSGYLKWYKDIEDEYIKQSNGPNAMTADEFADWHWQNYGQKEGRWGYNPIDAKAAPGPNEAANNPGFNSYVRNNPQLAKEYETSLYYGTKGYTFEEYAVLDWLSKGAPEGQGISLQKDGTYGFDAPKEDLFKSQFSDEQQKMIAKFYSDRTGGLGSRSSGSYDGPRAILGAMAEYGVSRQELQNAVAKYGMESIPEHSRPQGATSNQFSARYIDDLIDTTAKAVGLQEGFGGPAASLTKAHRALTPEEQDRVDFSRMLMELGAYGQSRGNVPGAIIADGVSRNAYGAYTTAEDLRAAQNLGHMYYQKANGEWSDARTDPNWRKDLAERAASEKARWAGLIKAGEGKVSPFVSGPQTGKNAPGKSVAELAPGLTVNGIRPGAVLPGGISVPQATTQARPPSGQPSSSQAVNSAIASATAPTKVTATNVPASQSVNQNDLGVMQKYGAEIKSDRTVANAYDSYLRDLKTIDGMAISASDKAALKEMAVQKIENAIKYRTGA